MTILICAGGEIRGHLQDAWSALISRCSAGQELPISYAPGGPALAAAGIVFCLWLLTTQSLAQAWFVLVIVAAGAAIGWATTRMRRARQTSGSLLLELAER